VLNRSPPKRWLNLFAGGGTTNPYRISIAPWTLKPSWKLRHQMAQKQAGSIPAILLTLALPRAIDLDLLKSLDDEQRLGLLKRVVWTFFALWQMPLQRFLNLWFFFNPWRQEVGMGSGPTPAPPLLLRLQSQLRVAHDFLSLFPVPWQNFIHTTATQLAWTPCIWNLLGDCSFFFDHQTVADAVQRNLELKVMKRCQLTENKSGLLKVQ